MKCCIFLLVSVVASVVLFFVLRSLLLQQEEEDPNYNNEDLNRIEKPTKACDDFYDAVCEKLPKTQTLEMSTDVYMQTNSIILNLLKEPKNLNSSRAVSIVTEFYSICLEKYSSGEDLKQILVLFSRSGGFPVLEGDKFNASNWTWLETIRKLRRLGLFSDSLFTTKLGSNPLDLRNTTLYIQNPRLDLAQREYCGKGQACVVSFALEFFEVVKKFGADREISLGDGIEIFFLEKTLLNMIWDNNKNSKDSLAKDQITTLKNMSSSFGFVNWAEYFTILLGSQDYITDDLVIVVENPGYLSSLEKVLENTPTRVLANFLMWSILLQIQKYIPGYKRSALDCYKFLQNKMPYALQSIYVDTLKFNDSKSEKIVLKIATKIKEELLKLLRSSEWISIQTKTELEEKIEKKKIKVGYPQILLNSTFIEEYYGNLSLHETALKSMLAIQKFFLDNYFNLCCKRIEEIFWDLSVDAALSIVYYDSAHNSIRIVQEALRNPVFNVEGPMGEHFGRLGSIIAHEMVHAVDSIGYLYNSDGELKSQYDESYLKDFENKSQCFAEQFNNFMEYTKDFISENPRTSGEFKKQEMIADCVGLDLSFAAYKTYEKTLNSSDMSEITDPLFFQGFAQFYCVKYSWEELLQVLLDVHAPNPYRFVSALNNSEHFGEVFGCEVGRRMNPGKKCKMW